VPWQLVMAQEVSMGRTFKCPRPRQNSQGVHMASMNMRFVAGINTPRENGRWWQLKNVSPRRSTQSRLLERGAQRWWVRWTRQRQLRREPEQNVREKEANGVGGSDKAGVRG